ncbi:MAG: outer membrane protein assembly factor BamD [Candidatus Zixiibacteriota bacterium]
MYKNIFLLCTVLFSSIMFTGCAAKKEMSEDPDNIYKKAEMLYQREKYSKAIEKLDHLLLAHFGSQYAAPAQMLLAKCYFEKGEYLTAASEFRRIVSAYGNSEFVEEAEFMIAESYWNLAPRADRDQTYTEQALMLYRDFLNFYPESDFADEAKKGIRQCLDKLAKKEYLATYIYYKLNDADAVILYSDLILEEYPNAAVIPEVLLLKAWAHKEKGEHLKATDIYNQIINSYPRSDATEKAADQLEEITDKL